MKSCGTKIEALSHLEVVENLVGGWADLGEDDKVDVVADEVDECGYGELDGGPKANRDLGVAIHVATSQHERLHPTKHNNTAQIP